MRYLLPDPASPGKRIVEEKISRRSTFGLLGAFYDESLDYPLPLAGIQYFDFDLWDKGKQISVFFAGALLTANYTDPALAGSRLIWERISSRSPSRSAMSPTATARKSPRRS